ncbi:hypothetical protein Q3G72_005284 [Acer saccharum]|nr:hypothetical protein Q3G72_005284 [Acer saccharum]
MRFLPYLTWLIESLGSLRVLCVAGAGVGTTAHALLSCKKLVSHLTPQGTLKLNTDAAFISNLSFFGLRAAIRDSEGKVLVALSKPFMGVFSMESKKVLALREGLVLAKQLGLQISWVEVDATNVATRVNFFKLFGGLAGFVFDDVHALFKDVGISKCQSISRKGNDLAHNLTSLAISYWKEQLWQENCPVSLV